MEGFVMMEFAIAREHDDRDDAIAWCRACIELAIERHNMSEGVDYSWEELRIIDRPGCVVELRLPIYG